MRVLIITLLAVTTTDHFSLGSPVPQATSNADDVGAVASNGKECGPIGIKVLKDGGNAIDSAIAVLLCEGVTGPQSMGIGGGFLATVYLKENLIIKTVNAREAAPKNTTTEMFKGLNEIKGGHATAVPSEIKGYWELKQRFGSKTYSWEKIFNHTINLCEKGYKVDAFLARILNEPQYKPRIKNTPSLKEIFTDANGEVFQEGDTAYRPKLAETLRKIAKNGAAEFYGGQTGQDFLDDVKAMGGVLTMEDLTNYTVLIDNAVQNFITDEFTAYTIGVPGSGNVLSYMLDLVKNNITKDLDKIKRTQLIVEAFKHGYGRRSNLADPYHENVQIELTNLNDDAYKQGIQGKIRLTSTSNDPSYYGAAYNSAPLDHGTSNVAVLDKDGNAITVTSTINNVFGAFVRSQKTGIILNDEMDDFSTPGVRNSYGIEPSPINYIKPGKRPLSSMTPTIILDQNKNVRMLIGAAGGSQITTSVTLAIIRHLLLGLPLQEAIGNPRFHHQLLPMAVMFEETFSDDAVKNALKSFGHKTQKVPTIQGFSAVTGISVVNGKVTPVYDPRRGGSAVTTNDNVE